jgi:hypothetical protein
VRGDEQAQGHGNRRDMDTLDGIVESARRQADPAAWVRRRVREALDRLDGSDHDPAVVEEARHQLRLIEERLLASLEGTG